jgi:hypothetical protein
VMWGGARDVGCPSPSCHQRCTVPPAILFPDELKRTPTMPLTPAQCIKAASAYRVSPIPFPSNTLRSLILPPPSSVFTGTNPSSEVHVPRRRARASRYAGPQAQDEMELELTSLGMNE